MESLDRQGCKLAVGRKPSDPEPAFAAGLIEPHFDGMSSTLEIDRGLLLRSSLAVQDQVASLVGRELEEVRAAGLHHQPAPPAYAEDPLRHERAEVRWSEDLRFTDVYVDRRAFPVWRQREVLDSQPGPIHDQHESQPTQEDRRDQAEDGGEVAWSKTLEPACLRPKLRSARALLHLRECQSILAACLRRVSRRRIGVQL